MTRGVPPDGSWSEYGFVCGLCGYMESWTTDVASNVAAVTHIRAEHPGMTRRHEFDIPAQGAPEQYGTRLEDWESQL